MDNSVVHGNAASDIPSSSFRGSFVNTIRCLNVPFHSQRREDFIDISVDVREHDQQHTTRCSLHSNSDVCTGTTKPHQDMDTLPSALSRLFETASVLENDNAYDTGRPEYGRQPAEHRVRLVGKRLPGALMIHLKRFKHRPSLLARQWTSEKVSVHSML